MKEQNKRIVSRRKFLGTAASLLSQRMYLGSNTALSLRVIKSEWHISDAVLRDLPNYHHCLPARIFS
jgi:hypothetical protein